MQSKTFASAVALIVAGTLSMGGAQARDQLQIVGSSTVFPFSMAVAEQFGQDSRFKIPVVESTGSGGGLKLFCSGVGEGTPDISNASRRMKTSELEACMANGVTPVEVTIGFDGIVLANSADGPAFDLTLEQIFLALAKVVPLEGKLVANPYRKWSDIDPALPGEKIEVIGPPPTSGTRDAFEELAMEAGCQAAADAQAVTIDGDGCMEMREDGVYIEAGENDTLIVHKLESNPHVLGIFGFSYLDQNSRMIKGATIGGVEPNFANIADAKYPVSRPLYFYIKKQHVGVIPGIMEYVAEFTSEAAWSYTGYLAGKGLIPLPDDKRAQSRAAAESLTAMGM
ncbi:substrate-binding domain-containing protein [Breoghania sp. L-A4]|uniref:substrate-binding domain-containing protein n=1 Tax=Breoghania sp. L-A4 TaxID=2304600 RepID=UPI000E35D6A4|nr:substrate-binding domain-containing protein [Breoghania sp. L-A4]AXS39614.1 phosphate ABC transporter substrate-binding protein [Breoghania sp. L-A4]